MTSIDTGIGQRIFDLRVERDVQQGELAQSIHMNQSVLNRIEKGTRPARDKEICALAQFFAVSADYLLGLSTTETSSAPDSLAAAPQTEARLPLSPTELSLLQKYRELDTRGKHAVEETISREHAYITPREKHAI